MNPDCATAAEALIGALDLIDQGVAYFDKDLRLVAWNAAYQTLGPGPDTPLSQGMSYLEIFVRALSAGRYPGVAHHEADWLRERERAPALSEHVFDDLTDTQRWVRMKQNRTPEGGLICVCTDISELKEKEHEVAETNDFMNSVLDFIPAQLTVKDEKLCYIFVNKAVGDVTHIPRERMIGHTIEEVYSPEVASFLTKRDDEALSRPGEIIESIDVMHMPGWGERYIRSLKRARPLSAGRHHIMSITEDVTQRVLTDAALKQAMREAEKASLAKSTFLATMSHEIRTPLNGVLGMAQVMAMDELSSPQRDRLDVIRKSGEALLSILNDVLDLSKIEAGKLALEDIEFTLEDTMRGAVQSYDSLAKEKGVRIDLDMGDAGGVYRGDPTRVRQILYNLISNALKFTARGSISVKADYGDEKLRLRVIDTGIGIAADKLDLLFAKFTQVDASTSRKFGGTGLGLSICRELAELMGGDIEVESEEGRGSIFTLTLSLPRLGQARAQIEVSSEPIDLEERKLRVLAAEDNPTNQLVLRSLLKFAGVDVTIVANGVEAVEAWAGQAWDVILMDVQMPVMDGPSATLEIRKREAAEGRARTPIIALTANTMSHQIEQYRAVGMDGHVAKPIEAKALFDALAAVEIQDEAPLGAAVQ